MNPLPPLALMLGVAVGCGGESDPATTTSPPADLERPDASGYESDLGGDLAATLTADDAATLTPSMLQLALSIDPPVIFSAYVALVSGADADCPSMVQLIDTSEEQGGQWEDPGCVSQTGTRFRGVGRLVVFSRTLENGNTEDGFELSTETFELEGSDGTFLRGVTQLYSAEIGEPSGSGTSYSLFYRGRLTADAATAGNNPWLQGDTVGDLNMFAGDWGGRTLEVSGTIRPAPGASISALDMTAMNISNWSCAADAFGNLSLRDAAGGWHHADFGGENDGSPCDACGDLRFGTTAIGSFCAEQGALGALLAWGSSPW